MVHCSAERGRDAPGAQVASGHAVGRGSRHPRRLVARLGRRDRQRDRGRCLVRDGVHVRCVLRGDGRRPRVRARFDGARVRDHAAVVLRHGHRHRPARRPARSSPARRDRRRAPAARPRADLARRHRRRGVRHVRHRCRTRWQPRHRAAVHRGQRVDRAPTGTGARGAGDRQRPGHVAARPARRAPDLGQRLARCLRLAGPHRRRCDRRRLRRRTAATSAPGAAGRHLDEAGRRDGHVPPAVRDHADVLRRALRGVRLRRRLRHRGGSRLRRRRAAGRDHRCIQHRGTARADHRLRSSRRGPHAAGLLGRAAGGVPAVARRRRLVPAARGVRRVARRRLRRLRRARPRGRARLLRGRRPRRGDGAGVPRVRTRRPPRATARGPARRRDRWVGDPDRVRARHLGGRVRDARSRCGRARWTCRREPGGSVAISALRRGARPESRTPSPGRACRLDPRRSSRTATPSRCRLRTDR